MKRKLLFVLGMALLARLLLCLVPLPPELTKGRPPVFDREGRTLREGDREVGELPVHVVEATLAAEDARFYQHCGVDLTATLRAAWDNVWAGKVVSGGSGLTQQLVAQSCGPASGLPGKAFEALRALRLETVLSKDEILRRYLQTVSYGHGTRGVESAARYYFGCSAGQLTAAEAAFLAAIPRGPTYYDPFVHPARVQERQRWILGRMGAPFADVTPEPHDGAFLAPHFCQRAGSSQTTLDLSLQKEVEHLVRQSVEPLRERGLNGAAVVVLHNATGEVRAYVGSPAFTDDANDGQVDQAAALRQPGSALKPFTYALALEGGLTGASLLQDEPFTHREFSPTNYDGTFHGPVRLRTALACSYNVPAVRVLHQVGVDRLLSRLRELGLGLPLEAEHYGLALTLGAGEVTLLDLTNAYRALARGGRWSPVLFAPGRSAERQVIKRDTASVLLDILSDAEAREPAFGRGSALELPFPCAVKTGTSRAYRDNWTVGCTSRYTVGVWAGHTRGLPMQEVSGVDGAGPIFHDVMLALHRDRAPAPFPQPRGRGMVCAESGLPAGAGCPVTVREFGVHGAACRHRRAAFRILTPAEGDRYVIDPVRDRAFQTLRLTATEPVQWSVDGRPCGEDWPLQPGEHVVTARGQSVRFTVTAPAR